MHDLRQWHFRSKTYKKRVFFTNKPPQIIAGHLKMHSALAGSYINIIHPFNRASSGLCRRRKGNTGQFSARNSPNLANIVQIQEFLNLTKSMQSLRNPLAHSCFTYEHKSCLETCLSSLLPRQELRYASNFNQNFEKSFTI